jgi:Protein of unknown function (DUF2971)
MISSWRASRGLTPQARFAGGKGDCDSPKLHHPITSIQSVQIVFYAPEINVMEYDFDADFAPIRARHPRYVFRYVKADDRLLPSIMNHYLWFSDPFNFNDPFDCRDIFDFDNTQDELEWWLKKYGSKFLPPDRWQKISERAFLDFRLRQEMAHRFYLAKMSEVSICCFARTCDNKLMWSHYADGHRGVCLVFDTLLLSNGGQFAVTSVNYTNDIPKWNHIRERKAHALRDTSILNLIRYFLVPKLLNGATSKRYGMSRIKEAQIPSFQTR